jgi:hypothetical protein
MIKIKKGMYLKYTHSPDDVVVQVKRIISASADEVVFLGLWVSGGIEQEFIINKLNESSWKESI